MKSFVGLFAALLITAQAAVAEGEPRPPAIGLPAAIDTPLDSPADEPESAPQPALDSDSSRVSTELDALLELRLSQETRVNAPSRGQVAAIN
ncbi:MAG: hypothetical protein KDI16_08485 [Halioglobus sp.]|nr:hypothetical protein [Halioglobus sp.]